MRINYIIGLYNTKMHGLLRIQDYILKYLTEKGAEIRLLTQKKPRKGFGWFSDYIIFPLKIRRLSKNCINHFNRADLALSLNYFNIPNSIVTCQDIQQLSLPNFVWNHSRLKFLLGFQGMRRAEEVITVSNFSKNEIHRYLKIPTNKIAVTYNGVNREIYKRNNKTAIEYRGKELKDFILSVSSEQPRKNIPTLLKIVQKLKADIPDILLIKVGRPDYPNARKKTLHLIKQLDLQENIILIDYVDPLKLPDFYNAAKLFITTTYYEGFTLPPLEAMACECPVVASNAASLPEALGGNYPLCSPFDVDSFVSMIKKILRNPSFRKNLISMGSKRIEQFNWEDTAKKTLQVYEELWAHM